MAKTPSSGSKPSSSSKPATSYTNMRDRFDGGGKGTAGPTFSGGPLSKAANAIGIKPLAARAATPSGGGGGADSGRAAARVEAQRAAGLAARNYKGNPDNSGGGGASRFMAALTDSAGAPAATAAPKTRRVYMGPPPKGYDAAKQGEWSYYKTETVDAPVTAAAAPVDPKARMQNAFVSMMNPRATPMKKGGKVRGCGCATRGTKGGKMV